MLHSLCSLQKDGSGDVGGGGGADGRCVLISKDGGSGPLGGVNERRRPPGERWGGGVRGGQGPARGYSGTLCPPPPPEGLGRCVEMLPHKWGGPSSFRRVFDRSLREGLPPTGNGGWRNGRGTHSSLQPLIHLEPNRFFLLVPSPEKTMHMNLSGIFMLHKLNFLRKFRSLGRQGCCPPKF